MSRRLLLVPVVVGPVAGGAAALWCSGLIWAIGVTFYRYIKAPVDEPDVIA